MHLSHRIFKFSIFLIILITQLSACEPKQGQQTRAQLPIVEVQTVTLKPENIEINVELPGRLTAYEVAEIRPQVSGIILKRMFEEGGLVTQGQQLYQIDPAVYQANFNTASAQLKRAKASLKSVTSLNQRYKELISIKGVSKQEVDDSTTALQQAQADIAIAKAVTETAEINLNYTKVFAPISGRIGKSLVTAGALVTANQAEPLAVIQQLDPIYADLAQSSTQVLQLRQKILEKKIQSNEDGTLVKIILDDLKQSYDKPGILKFSDITVEQTTGNISVRAVIPNPEQKLLPGLFVRAILNEGQLKDALLVPQQSVVRNREGGAMAWIVDNQNTAQQVPIEISEAIGDKWLVNKGLVSGQKVIIEGTIKAKPGTKVKPIDLVTPTAPSDSNTNTNINTKDSKNLRSGLAPNYQYILFGHNDFRT
ncbi:MAG: efflux RND transporter periplasmic adaptor subunit [Gammaproteobacteria bacterium]|nr:efflux RND transporter periplasmic adaptor subunit [Gammaproteobacteria bacterium]